MSATERTITGYPQSVPGRHQQSQHDRQINLNDPERWISGIGGGALALYGLKTGGWSGLLLAFAGGALVWRGATGHCDVYQALGINSTTGRGRNASVQHGQGIRVEKSMTINKSPQELYQFWRDFENLPRFMTHLAAVHKIDDRRSHWVAKAPAGTTIEWDAEIINEKENELIAWRSTGQTQVPNAGSVRFEKAPNGRGTEVKVSLNYEPPAGKIGSLLAKLFGEEPGIQVEEDLRHFKQIMETGEMPSVEGQPSGRSATSGSRR